MENALKSAGVLLADRKAGNYLGLGAMGAWAKVQW